MALAAEHPQPPPMVRTVDFLQDLDCDQQQVVKTAISPGASRCSVMRRLLRGYERKVCIEHRPDCHCHVRALLSLPLLRARGSHGGMRFSAQPPSRCPGRCHGKATLSQPTLPLETLLLRYLPVTRRRRRALHGVIALAVTLHTVILFPLSYLWRRASRPREFYLQLNLPVLSFVSSSCSSLSASWIRKSSRIQTAALWTHHRDQALPVAAK